MRSAVRRLTVLSTFCEIWEQLTAFRKHGSFKVSFETETKYLGADFGKFDRLLRSTSRICYSMIIAPRILLGRASRSEGRGREREAFEGAGEGAGETLRRVSGRVREGQWQGQ